MDAEERPPAPGPLRLVQDFVNTLEVLTGQDELGVPDSLRAWLAGPGLLREGEALSAGDLRRALQLREALRSATRGNNGEPEDASAVETLNGWASRSKLGVRFHGDHGDIEPAAGGLEGALGWILAVAFVAMVDGSWYRMKACRRCGRVFYDHSKNRSGTWCSMATCGNRSKAGAYRRRQRETRTAAR
jgi:predicted RNA-binding Zn ribbon-like protein